MRTPAEAPIAEAEPDDVVGQDIPADVLLVEDNMIIALDAEETIRELGVESVRTATGVDRALAAISERTPDFALLDVNLGAETSFKIAERLQAVGVPFAFVTGYSEQVAFPDAFRNTPQLRKPYSNKSLRLFLGRHASG